MLAEETARRGLRVSAGTVFTGLHRGPAVWEPTWEHVSEIAALTQAMGAGHLVVIPSFWRDDKTGKVLEDRTLTPTQWRDLTARPSGWATRCGSGTGCGSSSTRTRTRTSTARRTSAVSSTPPTPAWSRCCLDTGHYAYCGGDSVKLIETYGERIGYLHLKQVDPRILAEVRGGRAARSGRPWPRA